MSGLAASSLTPAAIAMLAVSAVVIAVYFHVAFRLARTARAESARIVTGALSSIVA
ncbi:MAG: hypothetical protein WB947_06345 [Thermoplasmata archaeon]